MKAAQILLWAIATRSGVDFSVNGETFQISNLGKGYWKRVFHDGSHPTRENVSQERIQKALDSATVFTLYKGHTPIGHSRQEFEQIVSAYIS